MKVKFDTHVHTCEVSSCGVLHATEIVDMYIAAGYAGITITDHLKNSENFAEDILPEALFERQMQGYRIARDYAAGRLTVFPGAEIRFTGGIDDYLILGLEEPALLELIRARPDSPAECKAVVNRLGGLLYEAHPYRPDHAPANPADIDGVEVYNGNPRHNSHNNMARAFALEHGLRMLSGSDAHQSYDIAHGGIIVDANIIASPSTLSAYLHATYSPELIETPLPPINK